MKNSPYSRYILIWALIPMLIVFGCSSDPSDPDDGDTPQDQVGVINNAGSWVNEAAEDTSRVSDGNQETTFYEDGTIWTCETTHVSLEESPEKFMLANSFVEIWPGAILQGNSLANDPPTAVRPRRGSGGVVIDIITGESETNSAEFDEVTKISMMEALNNIIGERIILPARFSLEVTKIESMESLRLALGLKVETFSTEIEGQLSFSTESHYSRYVVTLVQPFYQMQFVPPSSLDDWFHPEVTVDELQQDMGPGNPPVYVSSVTYGRKVHILVESTSSETEMEAHLEAHYEAVTTVDATIDMELEERMENMKISAYVWGGSASHSDYSNPSAESVQTLLTGDQQIQTGLMLSYTLKDIRNGETVQVKMATEYDVEECSPLGVGLSDKVFEYNADDVVTALFPWWQYDDGNNFQRSFTYDYTTKRFIRGSMGMCVNMDMVTSWPSAFPGGATLTGGAPNTLPIKIASDSPNQTVGPVVMFLSGFGLRTQLPFPGGDFAQNDYTIFLVMSGGRSEYGLDRRDVVCEPWPNGSYTCYNTPTTFMYAPDRTGPGFEGRNLMFGWQEDNLQWAHSGEPGPSYEHTDYAPSQEYKVYCLRYVKNHVGEMTTSIFINGVQTHELEEGELAEIEQLSGLILGSDKATELESGLISTINLRLMEGYAGAVTNDIVLQHSADLAAQEGL